MFITVHVTHVTVVLIKNDWNLINRRYEIGCFKFRRGFVTTVFHVYGVASSSSNLLRFRMVLFNIIGSFKSTANTRKTAILLSTFSASP